MGTSYSRRIGASHRVGLDMTIEPQLGPFLPGIAC